MDGRIEREKEETKDVVKNGYRCLKKRCWLGKTGQCGKVNGRWRKDCQWDLRAR